MMIKPREVVRARRARLVERAEAERGELTRAFGEWQKPLRNVDRGLAVYRGFKRSVPVIGFGAGVAMAALAFIRPENVSGWVSTGLDALRFLTERKSAARPTARPEASAAIAAHPAPESGAAG